MPNKSSLQEILQNVLSIASQEQNMAYAPYIYSNHFNIVTSFLIDRLVEKYPQKVDLLLPFIESKKIPVTSGFVQLPDEYRNLLGAPSINVRSDGSDCSDDNPVIIDTAQEAKLSALKAGCQSRPVVIVDKGQWDYQTTSSYDFPTYLNPIGLFIGNKRIKVCPYDLSVVEVTYCKKENIVSMAYIVQPDDTYLFTETGTVQSQWNDSAAEYLIRGILALYAAYSRDEGLVNFTQILNQQGIL